MYRHILIPTDGSELAEHAVTNGLSLAKSVGAKITLSSRSRSTGSAFQKREPRSGRHLISLPNIRNRSRNTPRMY